MEIITTAGKKCFAAHDVNSTAIAAAAAAAAKSESEMKLSDALQLTGLTEVVCALNCMVSELGLVKR